MSTAPTTQLIHGDCLDVMPTLERASVAMCFADLPYGILQHQWDTPINLNSFWKHIDDALRGNAARILTATQPFASALVSSNKKQFRYDLIWDKGHSTGFLNANRMPLRRHESVLVFYKKLPVYFPQKTEGKPYSRGVRPTNRNYGQTNTEHEHANLDGARHPASIMQIRSERTGLHPTQKPVALLEWLIKTYTNPGDIVLDPVAGSGTTAIAALRTGRHSICIEKDPVYFAAMQKRVADERARLDISTVQSIKASNR